MVRPIFALILFFCMVAHKAACHTFFEVNDDMVQILLVLEYFSHRILWLKICSVVLRSALNPACSSVINSSACSLRVDKKIRKTLRN